MKLKKQPVLACLIDAIGASARPMEVFSGFFESPGPPPWGDVGHRNGHQSGYILHCCFVCCRPDSHQGDTERVVPRWRRPVASDVALDMLHRAMLHVLLQRLHMIIDIRSTPPLHFLLDTTRSQKEPCYGPLKLTTSSNINLIGFISLFVSYWPPPATMDAVSAPIVAGGRARF
jgi:hypothetical protein